MSLQVGKNYLSAEWKQELITFSEFFKRIQTNDGTTVSIDIQKLPKLCNCKFLYIILKRTLYHKYKILMQMMLAN